MQLQKASGQQKSTQRPQGVEALLAAVGSMHTAAGQHRRRQRLGAVKLVLQADCQMQGSCLVCSPHAAATASGEPRMHTVLLLRVLVSYMQHSSPNGCRGHVASPLSCGAV